MQLKQGISLCLLIGSTFFLSSCLDIETRIQFASEESGRLQLEYTLSSILIQMRTTSAPDLLVPLPISREDFQKSVLAVPGLNLRSYDRKDFPEKSTILASLDFSTVSDLNAFFGGDKPVFTKGIERGERYLEVLIAPGSPNGLDPKTKEFLNAFFPTYSLRFHLTFPTPVKRTSLNKAQIEGNTTRLEIPLLEALDSLDPYKWRIFW
ncbi:MAG: hypothetical protein SNJ78_02205 [Spirochaetales bacterium]